MSEAVVLLDPGHGGYDPGAVAHGLEEKELNLALALKVAEKLGDLRVLLTRERDNYVSLADRVALSRRAEPDLFLSLHANAGGGRGFESFIYNGMGANAVSAQMQKALHGEVMGALMRWDTVDRGLKQAAFYVLRHNPHPAVLIESLFLDNAREAAIWRETGFTEALAVAVARGVRRALKIPLDGSQGGSDSEQPLNGEAALQTSTLYTVQVGAFSYIENARQRLGEAKSAGFNDAYIYQKII